ncbi:MAG: MoxR family ATPase [Chloroflexi bacterium]|nr:MoxR family ATPase [Chloroflexota bacterium]
MAVPQVAALVEEVSRVVIGKEELVELLLVALLAEGHVLIEGPPGVAKTLLCKAFAMAVGGHFNRVQGTPDMLPGDVTGFYLYLPDGESRLVPGPVFTNVLMIDELNRTTPRTQAAFLEAMQERQVTLEGVAHPIPPPFMVVASQVPTGAEGTYHLPETQIDRFMFRLWDDYPSPDEEARVLMTVDAIDMLAVQPIVATDDVVTLQRRVRDVYASPEVVNYIVALVQRLRRSTDVYLGPSPRASVALYKGARALAFLSGREYVIPDDVKRLAVPALEHRLVIRPEAGSDGVVPPAIVQEVMEAIPVPR